MDIDDNYTPDIILLRLFTSEKPTLLPKQKKDIKKEIIALIININAWKHK